MGRSLGDEKPGYFPLPLTLQRREGLAGSCMHRFSREGTIRIGIIMQSPAEQVPICSIAVQYFPPEDGR